MLKIIKWLKRLFGFRKYLDFANLFLNLVHMTIRDLEVIKNGGRIKLIDVDEDGVADIFDKHIDVTK